MHIHAKITAGSKREIFTKIRNNRFEIQVKEKAERNEANKRVIVLLAKEFKIPKNKIKVIKGHKSRNKILEIKVDPVRS